MIPGILPMVPGAGMYRIVYSIVMGPENMVGTYLLETATAAGAIAPWNFPRRSAAEDIFLRSPQVIYEKSEKFAKTKFFAFFVGFYDILNSVCALGRKKKSIGAFLRKKEEK